MSNVKLRCAILDDYQQVALAFGDWSVLVDEIEIRTFKKHISDEAALVAAIGDCEIVVAMRERTPFPESTLARLPRLRLLVTSGMRNSAIDLKAAAAKGVVVCGTHSNSEPPTELAWALILGLARNVIIENESFRRNGPWQTTVGLGLHGKRLGLLGLGKIGTRMARVGHAFGMEVDAWSPNLTCERTREAGVRLACSMHDLLEVSDFVSIHLQLSDRTRGLIGRHELRSMRRTAYLINTSRASIVDRDALVEALQNQWIAGAGLDVFDVEPVSASDVFRSLPNVLATPHLGYVTDTNYRAYFSDAIGNIQGFLAGAPVRVIF